MSGPRSFQRDAKRSYRHSAGPFSGAIRGGTAAPRHSAFREVHYRERIVSDTPHHGNGPKRPETFVPLIEVRVFSRSTLGRFALADVRMVT